MTDRVAPEELVEWCPVCGGSGFVARRFGPTYTKDWCDRCNGTGKLQNTPIRGGETE